MKRLTSFKDKDLQGNVREFKVVKRGTKYIVMVTQNGVDSLIRECGWRSTKAEACDDLENLASLIEGKNK